jgi:hypothetical protein
VQLPSVYEEEITDQEVYLCLPSRFNVFLSVSALQFHIQSTYSCRPVRVLLVFPFADPAGPGDCRTVPTDRARTLWKLLQRCVGEDEGQKDRGDVIAIANYEQLARSKSNWTTHFGPERK